MALVIFIGFFVLTLLGSLVTAYRFVQKEDRAFSSCLAKVWLGQTAQKNILEKLLDLNPQVKRLRADETRAKTRLANATSSGNPYAIAAAGAYLAYVEAQMLVLDGKQKSLLADAEMAARNFNTMAKPARAKANDQKTPDARKIQIKELHLAVQSDPPGEIAPYYYPRQPFSQTQEAGANWRFGSLPGSCHATIEYRGGQWFVRMSKGKS